ncbi:unnamed protein product [Adineta ricciae]|uniref:Uncharacterized protein n=1 Tax=Adineta ricciae TaxID=249248 RepID=A0A814VUJ8_ADIRI|nr:unnamed protein product [Adineta ricciae]
MSDENCSSPNNEEKSYVTFANALKSIISDYGTQKINKKRLRKDYNDKMKELRNPDHKTQPVLAMEGYGGRGRPGLHPEMEACEVLRELLKSGKYDVKDTDQEKLEGYQKLRAHCQHLIAELEVLKRAHGDLQEKYRQLEQQNDDLKEENLKLKDAKIYENFVKKLKDDLNNLLPNSQQIIIKVLFY